jgi:hypothetical protein
VNDNEGAPNATRAPLTDTDLDLRVQVAGAELLDYVRAASDPQVGLLALMDHADRATDSGPDDFCAQPGGAALAARVWAADVARTVIRSIGFAQALDAALAYALDISKASTLTRNLIRDLSFAVTRAHHLTCLLDRALTHDVAEALTHDIPLTLAITRDLDLELSFIRDRTIELDNDLDLLPGLTPGFVRSIARARHVARNLAREEEPARKLAALVQGIPVDVSGADLSELDVDFTDLTVLAGMVWSETTRWPPGVVARLQAYSDDVKQGVFRVRGGTEREEAEGVPV